MTTETLPAPCPRISESLKTAIIPDVAVKLVLGATMKTTPDGRNFVLFEGVENEIHPEDLKFACKIGSRVAASLTSKKVSPGAVISMMRIAQKATAEEIFTGDALRMIYYPVAQEASAFFRCIIPAMAMTSNGRVVAHISKQKLAREAIDYKVVVFQLDYSPQTLKLVKALRQMKKKVVFEVDDAFDALESWHPGYEHYKNAQVQEQIKAMMAEVDLVTVTTEYLKGRYELLARKIEIVPNCLGLADWPKAEANTSGTFRVLWAGSPSHIGDLEIVGKALSTFANNHPDVRLVFFGRQPVGIDCASAQVECHEWCDLKDYPVKLADLKADVAIAPLADKPFNYAKSNLRLIQYGATGYPIIASPVGEYKKAAGYVVHASTERDWVEQLEFSRLTAWRTDMKAKSLALAKEHDIMVRTPDIEKVYLDLAKE